MHLVETKGSLCTAKVPFTLGGSRSELGCSKGMVFTVVLHTIPPPPPCAQVPKGMFSEMTCTRFRF